MVASEVAHSIMIPRVVSSSAEVAVQAMLTTTRAAAADAAVVSCT
jgi:hypothetical protein